MAEDKYSSRAPQVSLVLLASTNKAQETQDPYCIGKPTSGIIVISDDLASTQAHRSSSCADYDHILPSNLHMQYRSAWTLCQDHCEVELTAALIISTCNNLLFRMTQRSY